jgi:hypothetical protein
MTDPRTTEIRTSEIRCTGPTPDRPTTRSAR